MAKAAAFKEVKEAQLQPAGGGEAVEPEGLSVFDDTSPGVTAGAIDEPEWLDFPEDKSGYPFNGHPVILTRDLVGEQMARWCKTRRYDAKAIKWVDDGFWVEANTRRKLYPSGLQPIAYRSLTRDDH